MSSSLVKEATFILSKMFPALASLNYRSVISHLAIDERLPLNVEDKICCNDSAPPHRAVQELLIQPLKLHITICMIEKREHSSWGFARTANPNHSFPRPRLGS